MPFTRQLDVIDLVSDGESSASAVPPTRGPPGAASARGNSLKLNGSTSKNRQSKFSNEDIIDDTSKSASQSKGRVASRSTPSTKAATIGNASANSSSKLANRSAENTPDGNAAQPKAYTLPRSLESPNSRSRQASSSRKVVNGSPMKDVGHSLLKRARENQSGSSDHSHSAKRRRVATPLNLQQSLSTSQTKSSQPSRSLSRGASSPINLISEPTSPDDIPGKVGSQTAKYPSRDSFPERKLDDSDTLSRNSLASPRGVGKSGRGNMAKMKAGAKAPKTAITIPRDSDEREPASVSRTSDQLDDQEAMPKKAAQKSTAKHPSRSNGIQSPKKSEGSGSTVSPSSKSTVTPRRSRVAQPPANPEHDDLSRSANSFRAGSGIDSLATTASKSSRRPSSEDDQGYASLDSNHLEETPKGQGATTCTVAEQAFYEHTATPAGSDADAGSMDAGIPLRSPLLKDEQPIANEPARLTRLKLSGTSKSVLAMSDLSLGKRVEMILGKYLEEFKGDNEHSAKLQMKRARYAHQHDANTDEAEERTSFAAMKPLPFTSVAKETPHANTWGVELLNAAGKPVSGKSLISAPVKTYSTKESKDVPDYANYVSIDGNILAPNVTTLHCWPYFGDDMQEDELKLEDQYDCDFQPRERKITQRLKAQQYEHYVTNALRDLECSYGDLLRFLLEDRPDVGQDKDAQTALQHRSEYCLQDFARHAERWVFVLDMLPKSNPEKLARIAVLCDSFHKLAKFSIWHIARRSHLCRIPDEELSRDDDKDLTCRVCLRFDCPNHGEMRQSPEDPNVAARESRVPSNFGHAKAVNTDIINPPKINYRTRIQFPPKVGSSAAAAARPNRNKHAHHWTSGNFKKADERGLFYPCHHPGRTCEDARCSCFENKVPCEKTCSCPPDCSRKFHGCACSTKVGRKLVCAEDPDCACYQSGRECDPDLCGGCGVCEVVDPVNKGDDGILHGRCRNASLQRGVDKHTLMGTSDIHGLGLYACETIQENEFVGEYIGEIILKEEADRRGAVYEHQRLSYLFSLNAAQEIDSTYLGNKLRFVNHAGGNKANLRARITIVNTTHRIGLYAERQIKAGEELLFDYGPMFPNEQLSGKKPTKSAPHVRNTNLVEQFYEVSTHTDELGNIRARKVTKATGKKKVGRKPYGSGSGRAAPAGSGSTPTRKKPQANGAVAKKDNDAESYTERGAGERLAAFNIAEEIIDDPMEVDGEDESDAFVPSDDWVRPASEESDVRSEVGKEPSKPSRRGRRRRGGMGSR